jgi:hypothetical protein
MLCTWKEVDQKFQCTRCGVVRRQEVVRACKGSPCKHLGDATGENELIPCETCQGNVRVKFPIYACAIHQLCLPTYTGTAEHQTCHNCRSNSLGYEAKETP